MKGFAQSRSTRERLANGNMMELVEVFDDPSDVPCICGHFGASLGVARRRCLASTSILAANSLRKFVLTMFDVFRYRRAVTSLAHRHHHHHAQSASAGCLAELA
jgi:hypothetical protein